jgi:hypothetical protein
MYPPLVDALAAAVGAELSNAEAAALGLVSSPSLQP